MANAVPLEPGKYYHIYNRGNNGENLLREERNYNYFLDLYARHFAPAAETYAYCLMRNHFHLLVRIRNANALAAPGQASQHLSNFFNAYTKAFNRTYQRSGALFQRPIQRIEVTTEAYLWRLVSYIHQNPQHHGFVADFRVWEHSSYHTLLSEKPTRLNRVAVLDWFGGRDNVSALPEKELSHDLVDVLAPGDPTWDAQGDTQPRPVRFRKT